MIDIQEIIRQLGSSAEAMRAMVGTIPDEQARWKPDADTWSMKEVMEHVYNEERLDFRRHLKEMFSDPPQSWQQIREEDLVSMDDCRQALDAFWIEREASLAWLKSLSAPDWERSSSTPWNSSIRAGDVLVSWVEHDFLHLRQMIELLYAWNEQQALPYSVRYAGGW